MIQECNASSVCICLNQTHSMHDFSIIFLIQAFKIYFQNLLSPHKALILEPNVHWFPSVIGETKSSAFFYCKLMCVCSSGVGRGRLRGKGGHLLLPPHPPTALPRQCYKHTLVWKKKSLEFVCPVFRYSFYGERYLRSREGVPWCGARVRRGVCDGVRGF